MMYVLLAIVFFGFLIFIHELGHFIVARLCGVKILEFAIGMGPKLLSYCSKKSGIRYSIRLFPIGGYVNMLGENGMELAQGSSEGDEEPERFFINQKADEDSPSDIEYKTKDTDPELAKQAYCNQSVWKRMLISIAGPFMNVLLGFLLMFVLVFVTRTTGLGTTVVHSFADWNTSSQAGLQAGDEIVRVGDTKVHTLYDLNYEISEQGYRAIDVEVKRNGERVTLENVQFRVAAQGSTHFGVRDFSVYPETKLGLGTLIKHTFWRSCSCVKMVYDSISGMFTKRYGMDAVSGPVGITGVITEAAKTSWLDVLHLLILISINLGVMNLLPLPALDGGHLLLYTVEAIRRKPIKPEIEGIINFIGLVLLLGLAVIITIKDVIAL